MPHDIIIGTAASLNQTVTRYAPEIRQRFFVDLEFEGPGDATLPYQACEHTFSAVNVSAASLLQAYQPQFTPKNAETFNAVENTLRPIKIDLEFSEDQLAELYDKWASNWFEAGNPATDWAFPRYIMEEVIAPQYAEELNSVAWAGEYVSPTLGTAGTVLGSVTGFKKKIADAITAGSLVPVASGAFTATTIREVLEAWMQAMPIAVRGRAGKIYMSYTNATRYYLDFRSEFATATWQSLGKSGSLKVDGMADVRIIGVKAMEGSNRWIFVPDNDDNMMVGTRRGYPTMPTFHFDPDLYTLRAKAVIYRFFGFKHWGRVFVNDQA